MVARAYDVGEVYIIGRTEDNLKAVAEKLNAIKADSAV